jgi:hypothetical protein
VTTSHFGDLGSLLALVIVIVAAAAMLLTNRAKSLLPQKKTSWPIDQVTRTKPIWGSQVCFPKSMLLM